MPSSHQHQTPERTQAEARVATAKKNFRKKFGLFTEAADDFFENAGLVGELDTFRKSMRVLDTAAEELHAAKSVGGG